MLCSVDTPTVPSRERAQPAPEEPDRGIPERAGDAVKAFFVKANGDNLTGLSAMVAYNLLLSIFPLALIALFIAGQVLESPELQQSVLQDLQQLFPSAAESTLTDVIRRIEDSSTSTGIIALIAAIWVSASFWGALDTAFCTIYRLPCRGWVRQKLFALGMLVVVLLFVAVTVAVPTAQSLLNSGAEDLPFGLSGVTGLMYGVTLALGLVVIFVILCAIYWRVPKGAIPWRCVWPGALGATIATGIIDYGFPLYLSNVSTVTRLGGAIVFIFVALLWFYALAMILLCGAVVNELRFEQVREPEPDDA